MALAEPAVVVLGKILRDESVPAADRIRAAVAVLDRTGFPAGLKLDAEMDLRTPGWHQVLEGLFSQPAAVEEAEPVPLAAAHEPYAIEAEPADEIEVFDATGERVPVAEERLHVPASEELPQSWGGTRISRARSR